ncbi:hypothetical protein SK128_022400 [Halocaridina rubra]|uniref:Lipase domain-containing protein n=1 Tax=Halocaridina rubra TaxID=373956 RepID=A0AAN8WDA3_HALRR
MNWFPSTLLKLCLIVLIPKSIGFVFIVPRYCFDEIGCIEVTQDFIEPLKRPINPAPFSRDKIGVSYTVRSRDDRLGQTFMGIDVPIIRSTTFRATKQTKILINGYLDLDGDTWYSDMVNALLDLDDFNVITVNWEGGSRTDYLQAAVNARVVGLEIAYLMEWLKDTLSYSASNFHLIGHSLGAHIAGYAGERTPDVQRISGLDPEYTLVQGYAGERTPDLQRISGLDPAEPLFKGLPPSVRLDPTDANFVDVIHTDSDSIYLLGLGMEQAVGHVDFYPNNGRRQPGCLNPLEAFFEGVGQGFDYIKGLSPDQSSFVTCSHSRSHRLFIDSIVSSTCTYDAYNCLSYEEFLQVSPHYFFA